MKLITPEEFKLELTKKLEVSHPGNLQIKIGDKLRLHYAESHDNDYDEDDNEFMTAMFMSMNYYDEHHDAVIRIQKNEPSVSFTQGELSDKLSDLLEDELSEYIKILWVAVDNWKLPD